MRELIREFVKFFVSLKLTVTLLALSALLIFLATIDQVNLGIWAVQEKWFKSWAVLHEIKGIPFPVFPGGYFIGLLLLINLVAAHAKRFAFTWKKAGIQLVHGGLILLLLGEFATGQFQEEYQLRLDEGQTKNYSESWRFNELAIIDTTSPTEDVVTVIPEKLLERGKSIETSALPFRIVPRTYYPNAALTMIDQLSSGQSSVDNPATSGIGPRFAVSPMRRTYDLESKNWPAAFVDIISGDGLIGTYLVSSLLIEPQSITYKGKSWQMALRSERAYKPYDLTLLKVTHEVYPGTTIPKNFSSRVRLTTPDRTEDREVLIFMNNPLRYDGLTFFQYQMDSANSTTVLQVVRNPSWVIPYLSCLLMSVGLYWQFGWHLVRYSATRNAPGKAKAPVMSDHSISLGLVLGLRLMAGLVALWAASSGQGATVLIALGVVAVEFIVCATLLGGLIAGRAWVHSMHIAYAWGALLLLGAVTAYGFLGGDIYDAILRWVVIGVHALTAAALLALLRRPAARIAS